MCTGRFAGYGRVRDTGGRSIISVWLCDVLYYVIHTRSRSEDRPSGSDMYVFYRIILEKLKYAWIFISYWSVVSRSELVSKWILYTAHYNCGS